MLRYHLFVYIHTVIFRMHVQKGIDIVGPEVVKSLIAFFIAHVYNIRKHS